MSWSHCYTKFSKIFQIAKKCCFCTLNFEVTCSKIGFTICILKICDTYFKSKYITGFKKFWGIFTARNFSKKFSSNCVKLQKNDRSYQNWQISTNEIENWEQITRSYWLNSVSERSVAPFFQNTTVIFLLSFGTQFSTSLKYLF